MLTRALLIGSVLYFGGITLNSSCGSNEPTMGERALYCLEQQHEYQMDISDEGYTIYDGTRCVGFVPIGEPLDSLMIADNL